MNKRVKEQINYTMLKKTKHKYFALMVPEAGFEPAQLVATTPSR